MNKVCLTGRITHDLDLRYTPSGKAVVQFNLAINRPKDQNGERQADFPTIVVWGQQAENLNKYQQKGSLICVVGRIQTRNYDDINGNKVYVTEILAENVEYLESKKDGNTTNSQTNQESQQNMQKKEEDPYAAFGTQISLDELDRTSLVSDDDLPF